MRKKKKIFFNVKPIVTEGFLENEIVNGEHTKKI
jgi:hypothetical protein